MADQGTLATLKSSISTVLDNGVGEGFISPQKHNNILVDVIDTISPTHGTATGTDSYSVAMSVTQVAYADHKLYLMSFPNTNTGAATLDVDGLGIKSIKNRELAELSAGNIVVGKIYEVRYNTVEDTLIITL